MKILATARHAAITLTRAAAVVGAVMGALAATPARALDVYVRVGQFTQPMPDGTQVPMWGYRVGATQAAALLGQGTAPLFGLSSPGAAITVPYNDTTLRVRLLNRLPVPTSFVLHGQNAVMTPVFTNTAGVTGCTPGTTTDCRVRSFTHETPPGNVDPVDYVFTNVKPGTYLYQSGTLPQIQVQMGLYGPMRKNAAPPAGVSGFNAYDNVPYSNEIALLFSEVDPAFHAAVAAGTFTGSTLAYDPKHFRIHRYYAGDNVVPTDVTANPNRGPTPITTPGQPLLLRMLNAGLQSRSMVLDDGHWYVMAEDGNPYPYPREQYSVFLPAAKTADVWLTPTIINTAATTDSNTITLFDRALALTNNNADSLGGMLFQMRASTTAPQPTIDVTSCVPTATQGASYGCSAIAAGAGTSRYALDIAPVGMSIDETSGAIAWVPTNDQAQRPADPTLTIPVRVRAVDGNGSVAVSPVVAIAVANVNDAPLAVNDTYTVRGGSLVITSPLLSVRANDSDPDGDPLGAVLLGVGPAGDSLTLNADGTFSFTTSNFTVDRLASFSYRVVDSSNRPSNDGVVTLNVKANVAPRTVEDTVAAVFNVYNATNPLLIDVLANDSDADGNLDPNSLVIVGAPNRGGTATVVDGANGRKWLRYVPPLGFRGTEAITYTVGDTAPTPLRSVATTVRINIQ